MKFNSSNRLKYYNGTESHNTVILDDYDQMLKGPRFMWFYPSSIKEVSLTETEREYIYMGNIESFKYLGKDILHKRIVRKNKNNKVWIIEDEVINKPSGILMKQLWHTLSEQVQIDSDVFMQNIQGKYSRYYGVQASNKQIEIITDKNIIRTIISIKS